MRAIILRNKSHRETASQKTETFDPEAKSKNFGSNLEEKLCKMEVNRGW